MTTTETRTLPYLINDADEHSTPSRYAYERYIDPDKKDMAIRVGKNAENRNEMIYNGRPPRFTYKNFQVVGSNELLEDGIKKRVATLAAQHVALGAGVQQNGLALALRSVRERRFDNQTRELLAVLHPRKTVARLSGCASRGRR